jgi:hypothetical protein
MIRLKPAKNFFSIFLTDLMLGTGATRPRRDPQYHRAKPLTSTLLKAGRFFCRHSEAGTPFLDMKLRGSGQRSEEGRKLKPLSKAVARVGHSLSTDLGPPAGSVCIFSKARLSFTIHYPPLHRPPVPSHSLLFDGNPQRCVFDPSAQEGEEQKAQGRGDSKVKWVEDERKGKNGNVKKGWSRS